MRLHEADKGRALANEIRQRQIFLSAGKIGGEHDQHEHEKRPEPTQGATPCRRDGAGSVVPGGVSPTGFSPGGFTLIGFAWCFLGHCLFLIPKCRLGRASPGSLPPAPRGALACSLC